MCIDLETRAAAIPSMGGREIGSHLRAWAAAVPAGHVIVELGCWLGAGTAQMALGVRDSGRAVEIHAFDHFEATASEVRKAHDAGVSLRSGESTLHRVGASLRSLGVPVVGHKGDIRDARWTPPKPIGLYVDDACKREPAFLHALRTFGPSWVPGVTVVVLMDFWYFEQRQGDAGLRFQYEWMRGHLSAFAPVAPHLPPTAAAAFRYVGGEPWR